MVIPVFLSFSIMKDILGTPSPKFPLHFLQNISKSNENEVQEKVSEVAQSIEKIFLIHTHMYELVLKSMFMKV